jgi:hypothetical protein
MICACSIVWIEPFFFDKQHAAVTSARPAGLDLCSTHTRIDERRLVQVGEIVAHFERTEPETLPTVRLAEMPARVVHYIPIDAGFTQIIRQNGLREVIVVPFAAGDFLNMPSRCVHDLSGIRWLLSGTGHLAVGFRHDLRGGFLDGYAALVRHTRMPIGPRHRTALLGLHRPRPLLGALADDADDVGRHAARLGSLICHRRSPSRPQR